MTPNCECPICMELILNVNCCTTECGHSFHSSCLFKNFSNSADCPLCRKELVNYPEEEDEEDLESEDLNSDDDNSEVEDEPILTTNQIECVIKKHGFTEKDILNTILIQEFYGKITISESMIKRFDDLNTLLDSIYNNEIAVDYRDNRTYANVLLGVSRTEEPGQGPRPIFE